MPKIYISTDGVVIKELQLTKDRSTLGRRPYNDIVIDNLAVSGEHAALQMAGNEVVLEDLNSTNGTYLNGKPIKKHTLQNGDTIDIGKYQIKFVSEGAPNKTFAHTNPGAQASAPAAQAPLQAAVRVMSGPAAGRMLPLNKPVNTVGKPGVAVAAISRSATGFVIALVEASSTPTVNGNPLSIHPINLRHGDLIEIAGTQIQYVLQ